MPFSIRSYRSDRDLNAVYTLWRAALEPQWPLSLDYFRMLSEQDTYHDGDHVVAEADGRIIGFAATHYNRRKGSILTLFVHPQARRQGVGRALHEAAWERLKPSGAAQVQLGGSSNHYFWPGVPLNLPGATAFFEACGWRFDETAYDLSRDLRDYATPPGVMERAFTQGITFRLPIAADAQAIMQFEEREFPGWSPYFRETLALGHYSKMLVGWDAQSQVVSSLLFYSARVDPVDTDAVWQSLSGEAMGGIGAVGVDASLHGRGIGLAMVARASEILQERGVHNCRIDWTDLLGFYGKLGYTVWREYGMAERRL